MKLTKDFRKIFAIPDIHGRRDQLEKALEVMKGAGYKPELDLLVVIGDMIDRGFDSYGVINTLIKLQTAHPENVVVLRGNHDDFAVDCYVKGQDKDLWYMNGGYITETSYPNHKMSEEHIKFLGGLPYSLQVGDFFFSHAPVPRENKRKGEFKHYGQIKSSLKGEEYSVYDLTWHYLGPECEKKGAYMDVHEGPLSDNGTGDKHLIGICGHIHRGPSVQDVRIFPMYRMLDVGCGCWSGAALAVHECVEQNTWYVYPEGFKRPEPWPVLGGTVK